jgi:N-methylhydantoinase A
LLGRIGMENFLSGQVRPDLAAVKMAFEELGTPVGLDAIETAQGVLRLANANMVNALKLVSTNKGYDPRDFALMAFGGGGALHALELAEELCIPRVIIPTNAAVFSAWGMLLTDIRRDYTMTELRALTSDASTAMRRTFAAMEDRARMDFTATGMNEAEMTFLHYADIRYVGQEHTVKIPVDLATLAAPSAVGAITNRFHADHETRYTFRLPEVSLEIVNFHLVASVYVVKPKPQLRAAGTRRLEQTKVGTRQVFFEHDGQIASTVYDGALLEPGMAITGPPVIQDSSSSVVLPPKHKLSVDSYGNFIIDLHLELHQESA